MPKHTASERSKNSGSSSKGGGKTITSAMRDQQAKPFAHPKPKKR